MWRPKRDVRKKGLLLVWAKYVWFTIAVVGVVVDWFIYTLYFPSTSFFDIFWFVSKNVLVRR